MTKWPSPTSMYTLSHIISHRVPSRSINFHCCILFHYMITQQQYITRLSVMSLMGIWIIFILELSWINNRNPWPCPLMSIWTLTWGETYFCVESFFLQRSTHIEVKLICKCFLALNLVSSNSSGMKIIMCFPFGAENKFIYRQTKDMSVTQNFSDRKRMCN